MSLLRQVFSWMYDGSGNPLSSILNAATGEYVLNVHADDIHTRIINKFVRQNTGTATTIATATTGDGTEYQIDVADATGFNVGDYVYINTASIETTLPVILATTAATGPATFTLDRRLDVAHNIGDVVEETIINIASQIGTLVSPQEYSVGPEPGEVWHITRLLFSMSHSSAGDLGKFGGIAALTNGVLLRAVVSGQYGTFTNWKTNGDIKSDMFDVEFDARSGGGGVYGTSGRGTFREAGAVVRLVGDTNDKIVVSVQDDITGINVFTMKFQGHFDSH